MIRFNLARYKNGDNYINYSANLQSCGFLISSLISYWV